MHAVDVRGDELPPRMDGEAALLERGDIKVAEEGLLDRLSDACTENASWCV